MRILLVIIILCDSFAHREQTYLYGTKAVCVAAIASPRRRDTQRVISHAYACPSRQRINRAYLSISLTALYDLHSDAVNAHKSGRHHFYPAAFFFSSNEGTNRTSADVGVENGSSGIGLIAQEREYFAAY